MVDTEPRRSPAASQQRAIRTFDFRRPTILSREHVRSIQIVQETFARGITTTLSSALRAAIQVSIGDIDQVSYDEYIQSVPNPTLLTNLSIAPLEGSALLQIPLRSAFMANELLLGGRGSPDQPTRSLTDLELALLRGTIDMLLPEIDRAFEPIASIESAFLGQEMNPQFAQLASPTDMVIVISFELSIENVTEIMSLCVPFATLQGRLEAMSTRSRLSNQSPDKVASERAMLEERTTSATVSGCATFRPAVMTSGQLKKIAIGDVLMLNHPLAMPLTLSVNGVATHEVTIGRVNRQYAVRVVGEAVPEAAPRPTRLHLAPGCGPQGATNRG